MKVLSVLGGRPLYGQVQIHGAKNAVLPILAATVATKETCVIRGCPDIRDVDTALEILRYLGCGVDTDGGVIAVNAAGLRRTEIPAGLMEKMRSSVLFLGALLAAEGEAVIYPPGGCVLGARPIDLHISGLRQLGASLLAQGDRLQFQAAKLAGGDVVLPYPSVGATENLLLAATAADDSVRIVGAAREPEISDLAGFLNACGADIRGAGTSVVTVYPAALHGADYRVMPDRMEAATYLSAVACAGGELTLRQMRPCHLQAVTERYEAAGCSIRSYDDALCVRAGGLHAVAPVITGPYPAFPTDAQATLMAALLKADGTSVMEETVFENRYRHVPQLRKLGADIELAGKIARIRGVRSLHGAAMEATDLRGGAAMLTAALGAEGESTLSHIYHMERGYDHMTQNLCRLGAKLELHGTDER